MSDIVTNAEVRAALTSINYNAANYQVLTGTIAFALLGSLTIIGASYISIQGQDQTMGSNTLVSLCIADIVFAVFIVFGYILYLRNIGRYVYGRIRPVGWTPEDKTCFTAKERGITTLT